MTSFRNFSNSLIAKLHLDFNFSELLKGSAFVFLFRFLGLFSGYALSFIIIKHFGESVLGIYSLSFTLLSFVVVLSRMGLDVALVKVISDLVVTNKQGQAKDAYLKSSWLILIVSLFLSVVVFQCAASLAMWFGNKDLVTAFEIVAYCAVPFALLKVNADTLRGMKIMRAYSYLQAGSMFLIMSIILLLWIYFGETSIYTPIYTLLFAAILLYLWSVRLVKRNFRFKRIGTEKVKRLMKISLPMMLTSSMFLVLSWTDNIFLGRFLSEDQVGIYFIAFKLGLVISLSLFAVNSIAAPKFSELAASADKEELQKFAMQTTKLNLWSSLPVFILLILSTEWLLSLYGASFSIAKTSVYILAVGQLYNALSGSVLSFLNMTGNENLVSRIVFSAAVLNILLNYYLIPIFHSSPNWLGIEGAAISSAVCLFYWNSLGLYFVKKKYGFVMFPNPFKFLNKHELNE
jgi:O-antigen/teichoic acid export membrane protein